MNINKEQPTNASKPDHTSVFNNEDNRLEITYGDTVYFKIINNSENPAEFYLDPKDIYRFYNAESLERFNCAMSKSVAFLFNESLIIKDNNSNIVNRFEFNSDNISDITKLLYKYVDNKKIKHEEEEERDAIRFFFVSDFDEALLTVRRKICGPGVYVFKLNFENIYGDFISISLSNSDVKKLISRCEDDIIFINSMCKNGNVMLVIDDMFIAYSDKTMIKVHMGSILDHSNFINFINR